MTETLIAIHCASCGTQFYTPSQWVNGHREPTTNQCGDCSDQPTLSGGVA